MLDINTLHKLIILLANAHDEPIKGRLKLQKMMFVLSCEIDDIKQQSNFEEEFSYMKQIGVLSNSHIKITLTNKGKKLAKELVKVEDKSILNLVNEYKWFFNDMTSKELRTYVYLAYPDMMVSSEYQNLQPFMEDHVFSLIKKQKISSQRAAELLCQTQTQIIEKMKDRGLLILK